MTERPILFSGPMVRALLAGTKTQTRRVVKPQPGELDRPFQLACDDSWHVTDSQGGHMSPLGSHDDGRCPYGKPGDTLWVREAWRLHERFSDVERIVYQANARGSWTEMHQDFQARPEPLKVSTGFKPSIHMPRWASRITLRVTDVRVERLNDCSEADAMAEGIIAWPDGRFAHDDFDPDPNRLASPNPAAAYAVLWEHINGPGSWEANPWVWAVSFERVDA